MFSLAVLVFTFPVAAPADLIVHNAKVITVDADFSIAQAVAIRDGHVAAVGTNADVLALRGPNTHVINAAGTTVLPGLSDSHTHPVGAAGSEFREPLPVLNTISEVQDYIRKKAAGTPAGQWIVLRYAFPTRLQEARFPTRAELDEAAPDHPVLYHAGPAGMVNTKGLQVSDITKNTPNPPAGQIVKDSQTGEPTGMLRNAYGILKGVPPAPAVDLSAAEKRTAVKKLFARYNALGLTSIADRNADRATLDLYQDLHAAGELTVRVNVARSFNPSGSRDDLVRRFDEIVGEDGRGGPTGVGDDWVRVGPIKLFLDGGMLNGSAYMRQPWPKGNTYQVTQDDYRGLLFIKPDQLRMVVAEAAKRKWQVTAHCAGEGAMDELLDAYEFVNRTTPIRDLRYCITHANFPSQHNLERCRAMGVCADVQPVWLYKDGHTLLNVLGSGRMRWFQPYKSWLEYTTIGGGSDHMIRYDAFHATNPWSPWLGMWVAVTRRLERGGVHQPSEVLTREQAIRLYTINNAYLHHEENKKGSLEVGKVGDLILIDRDVLTCPVDDIRDTTVRLTVIGGKIVYEMK